MKGDLSVKSSRILRCMAHPVFRNLIIVVSLMLFDLACTSPKEPGRDQHPLVGEWKALWKTSPEAFPGVTGIERFTMDGKLTFDQNGQVEIAAFGFPGCIFSSDTMRHQLRWSISNDTLSLASEDDPYGMPYNIIQLGSSKVELQLMDDISLSLHKL